MFYGLKHIAGLGYGYVLGLGFLSYAETWSWDLSLRFVQCEHVLHSIM